MIHKQNKQTRGRPNTLQINAYIISLSTRIRAFNAYVTLIFLHDIEVCTLTKNKEMKIEAFQGNFLRKIEHEMVTTNYKRGTFYQNKKNKVVRFHQKEETILV